ncbi:hypothetical protein J699_00144 [Acinetobacter sp. 1000160]|nr:hypothetical protein J522_2081 [Acinetobacter baumannii 146457]EYT23527.1 hypothetical protein J699_00144 [Acinetobacter sp. 1000160]
MYYSLNPDLPEWALSVLSVIANQDDEKIINANVNSTQLIQCE